MNVINNISASLNSNNGHSSPDSEGSDDSFNDVLKLNNNSFFNEKNLNNDQVDERKKLFYKLSTNIKLDRNNNNFFKTAKQQVYLKDENKDVVEIKEEKKLK